MIVMAFGLFLSNAIELNSIVTSSTSVDCSIKSNFLQCNSYFFSCKWTPGDGCLSFEHSNLQAANSSVESIEKFVSCDYVGTCEKDNNSTIELALIVFFCFFLFPFFSAMFAMTNAPNYCYSQRVNMFWTRYKETFVTGSARERIGRILFLSFGFSEIMETYFIYRHYRLSKAVIFFDCSALSQSLEACETTEFDLCTWNSNASLCEKRLFQTVPGSLDQHSLQNMLPANYLSLLLTVFILTVVIVFGTSVILSIYAFRGMITALFDDQNYYRLLVKPGFGCIGKCDNICSPPQQQSTPKHYLTEQNELLLIDSITPLNDEIVGNNEESCTEKKNVVEDIPIYERNGSELKEPMVATREDKSIKRGQFKDLIRDDTEEEIRQRIRDSGCEHWPRCCQIYCASESNKGIRERQLTFSEDINRLTLHNPTSLAYDKSFWRFFSLNAFFRIYMGCCFIALHGSHITTRYQERIQMLKYIYPQQLVYLREIAFGLFCSLPSLILIIIWEGKMSLFQDEERDKLRGLTLLWLNTFLTVRFVYYLYELALIRFGCHEDEHNAKVIPVATPDSSQENVYLSSGIQTPMGTPRVNFQGDRSSLTTHLLDDYHIM